MDPKIYEKMLKVRKAENLNLKKIRFLRDEITVKGKTFPFKLRNYQAQMVFHTLLSRRFIIGDDTGLGKCCLENSLISTTYGLVPIGDMHDWSGMEPETFAPIDREWHVLVDGEKLPVKNFYYGGVKPTIKMNSRYNFEVEGSRVHPLLVWRDCEHQWVQLQDIKEGDYICVERREMDFPTEEPTLDTDIALSPWAKSHKLPTKVTGDFARWIGYVVGEGWFNNDYTLSISQCPDRNPEIHEDIRHLTSTLFGYELSDVKDKLVSSVQIIDFLKQNGLNKGLAADKQVPNFILRSTREGNVEFLRGLFEGEGHVLPCGGIEFSTASEELGRVVQIMLTRLGIVCNRSVKKVKGYEHNTYWRLTIFGHDARIFRDKIGFVSQRKQEALIQALDRPTNPNHDVVPDCKPLVEALRSRLKKALSVAGSNDLRLGSGFKQYGTAFVNTLSQIRNNGRNLSYDFLETFLEVCAENGLSHTPEYEDLESLYQTRYFYDPVVSLKEGEAEVFDIEIDDPRHCFVGNGILNHNTAMAITTVGALWEKDPDLKVIVVTNTSVMKQWGGEIDKFTQGISWRIAEGGPQKRADLYEDYFDNWDSDQPEVLITNYHRLRRDKRVFRALAEGHRYCLILDEVTAVKNPDSQTHHVLRELSINADRVYGLTATLIKNNLTEGFGIYRVVVPELFKSKTGFYNNYCVTRMQRLPGKGKRKVPVVVGHTHKHIADFRRVIDPYYLGRAKHTVADELPVLQTRDISMPMERSQYAYYQEALEGLLTVHEGTEDEEEKEVTKLTQLIYTQQIVNSPNLIGNDVKSGKEEYFLELLKEELADEKVIVFTRFKEMVNRLENILVKDGYQLGIEQGADGNWQPCEDAKVTKGLVRITGDESSDQRDAGRKAFTESDNTNLIFLTMAGAEAINLQEARVMVFYDLPWSAGDYLQIVGRMIRIGSPHDRVYALHLLAETPDGYKTIDHHVRDTLEKKMGYITKTLGERLVKGSSQEIRTATEHDEEEVIEVETSNTSNLFDLMIDDARNGEKKNEEN